MDVEDRLLQEVRQLNKLLDLVKHELYACVDLDRLSIRGAVSYLVRQKRLLDSIKHLLKRSKRKPEDALNVLQDIEKLIEDDEQ